MSQLSKPLNSTEDDRLADFTDGVLAGRVEQVESSADEEMFALEETILRLKNAIPPASLDQAAMKRMQVRFKARVKRETQETKQPFWKKWFEPQTRLQLAMTFAAMMLLTAVVVFSPLSAGDGSSNSATALAPAKGTLAIIVLAGALLAFLWIKRRK